MRGCRKPGKALFWNALSLRTDLVASYHRPPAGVFCQPLVVMTDVAAAGPWSAEMTALTMFVDGGAFAFIVAPIVFGDGAS